MFDYQNRSYSFLKLKGRIYESEYRHFVIGTKALELVNQSLKAKILDVGCGGGGLTLLWQFKFPQFSFYGLDISSKAIDKAKLKKPGGFFRCSTLSKAKYNFKFDLVIMSEVIEHLSNPQKELLLVNEKLKKGGILYLTTQLEADCGNIFGLIYQKNKIKPKEKTTGHIVVFDRKSILKLLKQNGYKIEKIYYNTHLLGQIEDFLYNLLLLKTNFKYLDLSQNLSSKGKTSWLISSTIMRIISVVRNIGDSIFKNYPGLGIQIIARKIKE